MRRTAVVAAAGLAAACLTVVVPTSQAAVTLPGKDGSLNLYEDQYFDGHRLTRTSYDTDFGNDRYGVANSKSFNDAASSLSNRTGSWWALYEDKKYGGDVFCMKPNSRQDSLKSVRINDTISSAKKFKTKPSGCDLEFGQG